MYVARVDWASATDTTSVSDQPPSIHPSLPTQSLHDTKPQTSPYPPPLCLIQKAHNPNIHPLHHQYEYYSGSKTWSPLPTSASAIYTLSIQPGGYLSSGNVFWSPFYSTWMCIYMTSDGNDFYLIYSSSGQVQGPYDSSPPLQIFQSTPDLGCGGADCGNYAGTAYPFWRGPDAQEVVISWSWDGGKETQMALITFS